MSQEKTFNANSLNQKGAFIPLQVVRGSKLLTQNIPSTSTSSSNENNLNTIKNIQIQNVSVVSFIINILILIRMHFGNISLAKGDDIS